MTDYMEYVKGGDILIAPSSGYKHQYLLKCDQCGEYYGDVEQFFSHYLSHNYMESNEEDNLSPSGTMDKIQLYDDTIIDEGGYGIDDGSGTEGEHKRIPLDEANDTEDEAKYDIPSNDADIKDYLEVFEPEVKVEELMEIVAAPVDENDETKGLIIPKGKRVHEDPLETKVAATKRPKAADIRVKSEQIVNESDDDVNAYDFNCNEMDYEDSIDGTESEGEESDHKEIFAGKKAKWRTKPKKVLSSDVSSDDSKDSDFDVTISSTKEELDAEETELQEFDANCTNNAKKSEYESLELEESANNSTAELVDKSHEEEKSDEEDFVLNFLTSKGNVMAFIAAYRKQPHLWNFNFAVEYGKKPERVIAWKKIATELQKRRNIQILSDQVAAVIMYIRQRYRDKMENAQNSETQNNEILPLWMFEQLSFLKSFVETEPIATLDIHQDLSPQQTVQILGILKRCPHLWDTNTIEYYCTNKRNEAITQMKNILNEEIDLDVDECTLKRYLQALQDYSVIQKRHHRGYAKGTKRKSKYYQHMIFLFDHVAPFQCSHCPQKMYGPLQHKVHTSQHDGTIPLRCYVCNKGFKLVETYTYHIRRHMDDLNQECKECGKRFMRLYELRSHMRSHTGDKPFFCEVCGKSFRHKPSFNLHKKRHGKKYIAFCPYCLKGYYSKCALDMHIRTHKDERDFVCSTCGKAFKTTKTLRCHEFTHEEGRNHECDLCGKMFKNKINLSHHRRTHGNNKTVLNTK